jgi:hypothetical protein
MTSSKLKIVLGAFITWLVPLAVSFGLYNPETKIYLPNYLGFKIIMAVIAAITCFLTLRWLAKTQKLTPVVPAAYTALNSVLDVILLVGLLKMPVVIWVTTVFPIYVLVFGAIYGVAKR